MAADQSRIQAEMQQEHSALLAGGWNETQATRSQSLGPGSSGKQHSVKFREFLRLLLQLHLRFQELGEENRLDEGAEFRWDLSGSLGARHYNAVEKAEVFIFLWI